MLDYPDDIVGWLVDILKATDYHYSPREILAVEASYPGLWDDIAIELWQRDLVRKQMEGETGNDNGR